ncbi:hypothetical protein HKX48_008222 [Thoreauomyces humboldtii]|nr:hypothetical protein HKX48_008222 [Thoreauomyces humboldtii]
MTMTTPAQWQVNPLSPATYTDPLPDFPSSKRPSRPKACGVTVDLRLERSFFIAKGSVSGSVTVDVTKNRGVKIGRITVDVVGFEETTDPQTHTPNRRTFLHHTLPIQEATPTGTFATTEAVVPGHPDEHGMWIARKGRHTLAFEIPMQEVGEEREDGLRINVPGPVPLPSSFWEKKVGGVRYVVSCTLHLKHIVRTTPEPPLIASTTFNLLESVASSLTSPSFTSIAPTGTPTGIPQPTPPRCETTGTVNGRFLFSKKGEIHLQAVALPSPSPHWISGAPGLVHLSIENRSERTVKGLSISLVRRTKTFARSASTTTTGATLATGRGAGTALLPVTFARCVVGRRVWRREKRDGVEGLGGGENGVANGWSWKGVSKGEKRALVVDIDVPHHAAFFKVLTRSIRFGMLLDVSYVVQVSIKPNGSPAIQVEIPVTIFHPASLFHSLPSLVPTSTVHKTHPHQILDRDGTLDAAAFPFVTTDDEAGVAVAAEEVSQARRTPSPPPQEEQEECGKQEHLNLNQTSNQYQTTPMQSSFALPPTEPTLLATVAVPVPAPQPQPETPVIMNMNMTHPRRSLLQSIPTNPPSPAARRNASQGSSSTDSSDDRHGHADREAHGHVQTTHPVPPSPHPGHAAEERMGTEASSPQMEDITATIDRLFEGFSGV